MIGAPSAGAYRSAGHSSPTSTYDDVFARTHTFSVATSTRPTHFTLDDPTQPGTTARTGKP